MKIVIDANIIVSALIKEGIHRALILSDKFTFISPDFIIEEIEKHLSYISEKSGLDIIDLEVIFAILFQHIKVIPIEEYKESLLSSEIKSLNDKKDIPCVACCLATNSDGIWTNDKDFTVTRIKTKVYTTKAILDILKDS